MRNGIQAMWTIKGITWDNFIISDPALIKQMIENPYETRSDSFYFVNKKLIMHNKADYSYNGSISS